MLARTCALGASMLAACGGPRGGQPAAVPPPVVVPPPDAAPADAAPPAPEGYVGLGAGSVDPAVVAAHAPPPLSPEVSARIEAMLDARAAPAGALTSAGDRMVFTWRVTGRAQVWRADGPRAFPVQLTGGEDHSSLAAIAPDDAHLVISRDHGGSEDPGLYWMSIEGGAPTPILARAGVQARLAFVSDDSRWVYYLSNDGTPGSYALARWDVRTGAREAVFTEPGLWSVLDRRPRAAIDPALPALPAGVDPATRVGDVLLLSRALGNAQNEVFELDLGTGALSPRLGVGQPADAGPDEREQYQAVFDATPGGLLVRTDARDDRLRLYRWRAGEFTPVTPVQPAEIAAMTIDHPRTRIYLVVNDGGRRRVEVLDARTGRALALPPPPAPIRGDNAWLSGLSRDGRFVQVTFDGARQLPTTVVWDWRRKAWATWTLGSAPELDVARFAPVTIEQYPARDGTPIPMLVRRPPGCPAPDAPGATPPCPVVVQFHGGPEIQALPSFSPLAQLYVDAGFVFVEPNVRGSAGYGKAWLHADDGPRRVQVITDVEDCARHLRTAWARGGVAPRLGVVGRSYGGYTSLYAMSVFAGAYDVGVAEVAIASLPSFLANTAPYRRALRISEYGDPVRDAEVLRELSPLTHADRVVAPLLLLHGVNDPRVPVGEALQMYAALERRGIPGGLILFADEGHGTSSRANQVLALGHTLAFFEQHLR
ncbi:MAG: prolyl oligopeptidase family serine peptidase [Kofleriaceae bacterium]